MTNFLGYAQTSFNDWKEKGYTQLMYGDVVIARHDLEKAATMLPETLPLEEKAIFFNNLGVAYYKLGEYQKGINSYKTALDCHLRIHNDTLIAESIHNLGLAYKEIGLFGHATEELIRSARMFEQIGYLKDLASAWNAIGNVHRELGDFKKALEYHQKALQIRKSIGYEKGIADSYHNIGSVYLDSRQFERAEVNLLEALQRKKQLSNKANLLSTLTLLGQVYLETNRNEKALPLLNEAYNLRRESGNTPKMASSLYYLGTYYSKAGDRKKAYDAYRQSAELAETAGDYALLADALTGEIQLLRTEGNNQLLVSKYEKLLEIRDKIALDANRKELAKLEIAYDVERKNQEIQTRRKQAKLDQARIENQRLRNQQLIGWLIFSVLFAGVISFALIRLRQRKRRIEQQNRELDAQKQEITDLHNELSHRTKNYFALMSGILKSDKKSVASVEATKVLDDNIRRLEAMSSVQHYLLDDSTREKKEVSLHAYLGNLIGNLELSLFSKPGNIRLHQELDEVYIDYDVAMRLAIALNELICNAVEHGFQGVDSPELLITLKQMEKRVELIVRDNGPGISEELIESKNTKGRDLISKILSKVSGTVTYRNENGCVASVVVDMKKSGQ